MTAQEIFERIEEVIKRKGMVKLDISKKLGMRRDAVFVIIKNKACRLHTALDLIDEVGLELQFDNKPMGCHEDLIDYINELKPINRRIARKTGITDETIARFRSGENVNFDSAIRIVEALGIEVRVV